MAKQKRLYEYNLTSYKVQGPNYAPKDKAVLRSWNAYLNKMRTGQARGMISGKEQYFNYDDYYDVYKLIKKDNPSSKNIAADIVEEYKLFSTEAKAKKFYKKALKELESKAVEVEEVLNIGKGKTTSITRKQVTFDIQEKSGRTTNIRQKTIYIDDYTGADLFGRQFNSKSEIIAFRINVLNENREKVMKDYGY